MSPKEKLDRLHEALIAEAASQANDSVKRWVSTMGFANAGGLLGAVSLAAPDESSALLYLLLPSMWLFLIGSAASSVAFFCNGLAWRYDENSYRLSSANDGWAEAGETDKIDESVVQSFDQKAEKTRQFAAWSAIFAAAGFALGVAVPLTQLSYRAYFGVL